MPVREGTAYTKRIGATPRCAISTCRLSVEAKLVSNVRRSLVHIGLPKAASTALQKHFFPLLGVTYLPCYADDAMMKWYKDIRYAAAFKPVLQKNQLVISGEGLCGPGEVGAEAVADRLLHTVGEAVILVVVREHMAHFRSAYREMVLYEVWRLKDAHPPPGSAWKHKDLITLDAYLATSLKHTHGGYFHYMNLDANIEHFKKRFEVLIVDHSMIAQNLPEFTALVCRAMGVALPADMPRSLPYENVRTLDHLKACLDEVPLGLVSNAVRAQLIESYTDPVMSPAARKQFEHYLLPRVARTFAEALR